MGMQNTKNIEDIIVRKNKVKGVALTVIEIYFHFTIIEILLLK